ncbi:MAG TPA: lysophospholipid acyltransferase family protein [Bryobacteraceae bacterium]|nr:lysophospholipid acyltransferase family protein [Bryobacteraceae bacterium]
MTSAHPVSDAARALFAETHLNPAAGWILEKLLLPQELDAALIDASAEPEGQQLFEKVLEKLDLRCQCDPCDLHRVPKRGPVVAVANHPFGLAEGVILGSLLLRVRPDVKFLANSMLASVPGVGQYVFPVNPFGGAAKENWKSLRQSIDWVKNGGMLVVFPAGEVSSLDLARLEIADPKWDHKVTRIIQMAGATSLPMFFHGVNSAMFQVAGLIHPRLRTMLLPRELANKRGGEIRVSIGRPIKPQTLIRLKAESEATDYLRQRTHLLDIRQRQPRKMWRVGLKPAPVIPAVRALDLSDEIAALPAECKLLESGGYEVYAAKADQIPNGLREIGRLREITFRHAGEGTGRSIDIDRFDRDYLHLFLWNTDSNEIAGAYRLAGTDVAKDLYTRTLFKFREGLLESMSPALELGRSFVRLEYQKSFSALLLLWKGIGRYVARNPRYRSLFGPVSISREYSEASRALIVAYLRERCGNGDLARYVEPRREFRAPRLRGCDPRLLAHLLDNVEELSDAVADMEPDGKGVPVLLRQYLNCGGEMLAFNVDSAFSDVVDGLVVVDLSKMSRAQQEKYLGKEGAARFREAHS